MDVRKMLSEMTSSIFYIQVCVSIIYMQCVYIGLLVDMINKMRMKVHIWIKLLVCLCMKNIGF